jgi:dTDP-D-glucose 4,6-dehydratase
MHDSSVTVNIRNGALDYPGDNDLPPWKLQPIDTGRAFREDDPMGGHDPYSRSKAACEKVVSCYRQSYFADLGVPLARARAGN